MLCFYSMRYSGNRVCYFLQDLASFCSALASILEKNVIYLEHVMDVHVRYCNPEDKCEEGGYTMKNAIRSYFTQAWEAYVEMYTHGC